jgi:hypothetical protein
VEIRSSSERIDGGSWEPAGTFAAHAIRESAPGSVLARDYLSVCLLDPNPSHVAIEVVYPIQLFQNVSRDDSSPSVFLVGADWLPMLSAFFGMQTNIVRKRDGIPIRTLQQDDPLLKIKRLRWGTLRACVQCRRFFSVQLRPKYHQSRCPLCADSLPDSAKTRWNRISHLMIMRFNRSQEARNTWGETAAIAYRTWASRSRPDLFQRAPWSVEDLDEWEKKWVPKWLSRGRPRTPRRPLN